MTPIGAERSKALPLSRASYGESLADAESTLLTEVLKAEGDIAQINALSDVRQKSRKGYELNAYFDMIDEALMSKKIVIKDPRLSNSDMRLWNEKSK